MNTPLKKMMIDGIMKSPSEYLQTGFTATGIYANRRQRKLKHKLHNNRRATRGRKLQTIHLRNGKTKQILHEK